MLKRFDLNLHATVLERNHIIAVGFFTGPRRKCRAGLSQDRPEWSLILMGKAGNKGSVIMAEENQIDATLDESTQNAGFAFRNGFLCLIFIDTFRNLVKNACQAMQRSEMRDRRLSSKTTRVYDGQVGVCLEDNGPAAEENPL
jgi:hypothetical protein